MALVTVFALVQRSNARADARAAHARELDAAAPRCFRSIRSSASSLPGSPPRLSPTPTAETCYASRCSPSRVRTVVVAGTAAAHGCGRRDATVMAADDGSVLVARAGSRGDRQTGHRILDASIDRCRHRAADRRRRAPAARHRRRVPLVPQRRRRRAGRTYRRTACWLRFVRGRRRRSCARRRALRRSRSRGRPRRQATAASISTGGRLLATGGIDDVVRIWRFDGRLRRTLEGHVGQITAVAFSPRGTRRDREHGRGRPGLARRQRPSRVRALGPRELPRRHRLQSGRRAGRRLPAPIATARTWKAETRELPGLFAGSTERVTSASLRPGRNVRLVTASLDGTARSGTRSSSRSCRSSPLGAPVTQVEFVATAPAHRGVDGGACLSHRRADREVTPVGHRCRPSPARSSPARTAGRRRSTERPSSL